MSTYDLQHLNALVGTPVDLAPWSYLWRRDRDRQSTPEAYFIPHRLKRQDEVYRTHLKTLGRETAKAICYANQPDMLEEFPPAPAHPLLTGLLWVGGVNDYRVELIWPQNSLPPDPATLDVRTYPTAWGWFGWTVDRVMTRLDSASTSHVWCYAPPADLMIDYSYNARVKAQTEMIAVFAPEGTPIPELRVTGDSLGTWQALTFTIEWGFDDRLPDWQGDYEGHVALIAPPTIEGKRATFTCLYSPISRYGLDSRITIVTDRERGLGATVLLRDLAKGPICVPEAGLFFCPAGTELCAMQYIQQQKSDGRQTIRARVAAHPEAHDWEEVLKKVRLWQCPAGTDIPPFPASPAPAVTLRVPDSRWQTMYELAVEQLRGPHMWGHLASEVYRVAAAMELCGLYEYADKIYDYFLASPGVMPDADYPDAAGALEWAVHMRHGMAYAHEGCHFSTGGILYAMMHRYRMTGDRAWLQARLPRLKQAADWIIRMLRTYMQNEMSDREGLQVDGLMPPAFNGDYALPCSDWRWYYYDNAIHQMGLRYFSDILAELDDPDAPHYLAETARYEKDLAAAVRREALLAPVRPGSDGFHHSFIPRMAYAGGLLLYREETNVPQFANGICDLFFGALPLADLGGIMEPEDRRMRGTVDAMEEGGLQLNLSRLEQLAHPTADESGDEIAARMHSEHTVAARASTPPDLADVWFWNIFSNLPKISHNAGLYLRQDDIPSFLRFFFNHAAMVVGDNGKLWEHAHPDTFTSCENPDNGTAGWFVETFRFMLVMEDREVLWLAKGTPRAWLAQYCEIAVEHAPTLYGDLSYCIRSDVDHGVIRATVQVPDRKPVPALHLRLRHPQSRKITSVTADGASAAIAPDGETIMLASPRGTLHLEIRYDD